MASVDRSRWATWTQRFQGLWRHSDFMKLWTGQTVSEFGSNITRDGLGLAALLVLNATPTQMGFLTAMGAVPVLLLGLFAGVWVDRLRRRPLMIVADLARAAMLFTIPVAALAGALSMAQLYVVVVVAGAFTVLFEAAYHAYLPGLVTREQLMDANSKLALSSSLAEVAGTGLAGILVQLVTAPLAILIDSLSFVFSAFSLGRIRQPESLPVAPAHPNVLGEAMDGVRMLLADPILRPLALSAGIRSFFGSFIGVLYGLYAIRDLGLSPALLGITIATGGIGSLLGSVVAERVTHRLGVGRTLVLTSLAGTATALMIPLAGSVSFGLGLTILLLAQLFGDVLWTIRAIGDVSLRQAVTPGYLLGRTNASLQLLVAGLGPCGAVIGGMLGTAIGAQATLVIAALGAGLLGTLVLVLSPVRRVRDLPDSHDVTSQL